MLNTVENAHEKFVVIDTETTWQNELMSIGAVVADSANFEPVSQRYYILLPYKNHGGMYSNVLYVRNVKPDFEGDRETVIDNLKRFLNEQNVYKIFAYNALFDFKQLPELAQYNWFDIMKIAAYRQYNDKISADDCFKTGRLKRGFGVESIYRMLSANKLYCETHNALFDAVDELMIMKMLDLEIGKYDTVRNI